MGGGDESDGEDAAADEKKEEARKKQEEEDAKEMTTVEKGTNRSLVQLVANESKLPLRGTFSALNLTNWLWYRCVRPKLEETKSKLPELTEDEMEKLGIPDVEEVLGEYMPVIKVKDDKDKKDKDDKKDKKDKDDKKDKKDKKDDKKDDKKAKK